MTEFYEFGLLGMFSKKLFAKLNAHEEQELNRKRERERHAEIEHEVKLQQAKPGTIHFELAKLRQRQLVKKGLQEFKHQAPVATRKLFGRAKFEREQLEREIKSTFETADKPRRVRNFFVVGQVTDFSNNAKGEFDLDAVANGLSHEQAVRETDNEIMQRQLDQIAEIFQMAIRLYWKEKLYNCDDEILRIVFTEFYFYRFKEKGGYSSEYMERLKQRLIPLGKRLMENMEAFVGTWGVKDEKSNSSNMGFYLQGGSNPVVTQITKSVASRIDLILNDSIYFLHQEIEVYQHLIKLIELVKATKVDLNSIDVLLEKVNKLANCSWSDAFGKCLAEMKATHPKQDAIKNLFFGKILKIRTEMRGYITDKSFEKIYAATWGDINSPVHGMSGEFSRVIHCKTGAGEVLVIPEICSDHQLGIGKLAAEMKVMEAMKAAPELFFPPVSHLVSSSSTEIVERHMLSNVLEHCDSNMRQVGVHVKDINPLDPNNAPPIKRKKSDKIREIPYTFFGGSVKLVLAKPVELCHLNRKFSHEPFRKKLLMLRKLRERNPQSIQIYDKFILLAILKFCQKKLRKDIYNSSSPEVTCIQKEIIAVSDAIEKDREFEFAKLFETFEPVMIKKEGHTWRILDVTKVMLMNELQERAQRSEAKGSTIESRRLHVRWS